VGVSMDVLRPGTAHDTAVIEFRGGLVGLPSLTRFLLVERGPTPWWWLQSLDLPAVALAVIDPLKAEPDYSPLLPDTALRDVQAESVRDVALLCVAIPHADGSASVNLMAPLVIHVPKRLAVQVVLEPGSYPLRHHFPG
jgi:flagellar assembly factor FliW